MNYLIVLGIVFVTIAHVQCVPMSVESTLKAKLSDSQIVMESIPQEGEYLS